MSLSAFFAQNAKKVENKKVFISDRFVDEKGEPILFEIKSMTAAENQRLRDGNMKLKPILGGKKGQVTPTLDTTAYQRAVIANCCVYPDFNNEELQQSYGVVGAEQLASTMLEAGEFDQLVIEILEHCGFVDRDELVEEAKN